MHTHTHMHTPVTGLNGLGGKNIPRRQRAVETLNPNP
jgi:hypothetical protein